MCVRFGLLSVNIILTVINFVFFQFTQILECYKKEYVFFFYLILFHNHIFIVYLTIFMKKTMISPVLFSDSSFQTCHSIINRFYILLLHMSLDLKNIFRLLDDSCIKAFYSHTYFCTAFE